jgi:hypothetical protein
MPENRVDAAIMPLERLDDKVVLEIPNLGSIGIRL